MPLRLGTRSFDAFYLGSRRLDRLYLGNNLLWPDTLEPPVSRPLVRDPDRDLPYDTISAAVGQAADR